MECSNSLISPLKILVFKNHELLITADHLQILLRTNDFEFRMSFSGLTVQNDVIIPENTSLRIQISMGSSYQEEMEISALEEIRIGADIKEFEGRFWGDASVMHFNQGIHDVLRGWSLGDSKYENWKYLKTKEKIDYLLASCTLYKIQTHFLPTSFVIVDGAVVKTKMDFYCHLGEVFFGKRGYLGCNLDALRDCISSFKVHESNQTLYFQNFDQIERALNTPKHFKLYGESYTEIILRIFRERGFEVIFIP